MGTFVSAKISGTTVSNIARVPRAALRGADQVIIVDVENRIRFRSVTVVKSDAEFSYVSEGLGSGDRVLLTAIENPISGTLVRVSGEADEPDADGARIASGEVD